MTPSNESYKLRSWCPGGADPVSSESQICPSPYQSVGMQHASTVRLDNSKVVREIAKDTDPAGVCGEQAVQDGFVDMMEKLDDGHRVGGSCSVIGSAVCTSISRGKDSICQSIPF